MEHMKRCAGRMVLSGAAACRQLGRLCLRASLHSGRAATAAGAHALAHATVAWFCAHAQRKGCCTCMCTMSTLRT